MLEKSHLGQLSLAGLGQLGWVDYVGPPISKGHNFFVRTPFRVFLDSMESQLSQEYIHMPDEDIRHQTEVLYQVRSGQVSSASSGFDYV